MSRRREFLKQVSAVGAGLAAPSWCRAEPAKAMRVIDTHTHFYDPTRAGGVPWPEKASWLDRPVYPKDWLAVAAPHGVRETVVVEASPLVEDNQWILDLAAREKSIVGFVGNLSPADANFAKHLRRFAADPIFRGIRVSGDGLAGSDKTEFRAGAKLMAELGLELDVNGSMLDERVARLAADLPELRIVVDHVGSAGDAAHLTDAWRSGLKALGAQKNVFCKVSALTEQTDQSSGKHGSAPRDTAYYKPILDHCWECFGEDRLIYGSNWPVCEKGGSYADQFKIVSEYFGDKGRQASEKYFCTSALAAYRCVQR